MAVPAEQNATAPAAAETPQPPEKVAVLRAEVIMLLLLLLLGMGVWGTVEMGVGWLTKGWEPREKLAQIEEQLPRYEAALALITEERKATQEQLVAARVELAKQEAMLGALGVPPAF